MSLQVYFGETLIDEQYYTGLTNNNELFNESFKLGSTPSNTFKLSIAKEGVENHPTEIILKDGGTTFANLQIDNIEEQDYEYVYTLTDKMLDLEFKYDASEIFVNGATTLLLIAQDICSKVGLTLGTVDFRGYNKVINWYDNTRTAREYISMIAELNGSFVRIENNTLYFRKQNTASAKTISINDCENFTIGEYHKITRVVYELGALKYEFGDETGNTLYLNPDNVFITEESEVEAIYNEIKNFEFYSFETSNCPIDYSIKVGDVITFADGINNYPTIAQYDLEYFGGWIGGYKLSINTERQEETKVIGTKENIRNLKIIVNRQENSINQIVEEIGDRTQKQTTITQDIDEINQKVEEAIDLTNTETGIKRVTISDAYPNENILELHIYGNNSVFDYLYPADDLYPSDTLYPYGDSRIRFHNSSEDKTIELGIDEVLRKNDNVKDEVFIDNKDVYLIRRVNADGTTKSQEVKTLLGQLDFVLQEGDNTFEIVNYSASIEVKYATKNDYTDIFATKKETSSEITQKANEITSTVSETYETKENAQTNYSQWQQTAEGISSIVSTKVGENEIISKINQSAEAVQINANKISLNGKQINLTGDNTTITSNNFNVDSNGNMTCSNASITGGTINLTSNTDNLAKIKVYNSNDASTYAAIHRKGFGAVYNNKELATLRIIQSQTTGGGAYYTGGIELDNTLDNNKNRIYADQIHLSDGINNTYIWADGIRTPTVTQTSRKEDKKNFEKLQNALDIVKTTDIYKYNLKNQTDGDKKHIGFVIGEDFKYSEEITSENNDGVDTYSMISVAYKAVQEQQEQIEQLQEEIRKLKEEK